MIVREISILDPEAAEAIFDYCMAHDTDYRQVHGKQSMLEWVYIARIWDFDRFCRHWYGFGIAEAI